jgi:hypothetical protein
MTEAEAAALRAFLHGAAGPKDVVRSGSTPAGGAESAAGRSPRPILSASPR